MAPYIPHDCPECRPPVRRIWLKLAGWLLALVRGRRSDPIARAGDDERHSLVPPRRCF